VRSLAVLKNGLLASGADDFTLKIWNLSTETLLHTFDKTNGGHSNQIRRLIVIKENFLVSASLDKSIKIWEVNNGAKLKYTFDASNGGHQDAVVSLASNENIAVFASGSADNSIKLWDYSYIDNIRLKNNLEGHTAIVVGLIWIDNIRLASSSYDKSVKIWETNSGKLNFTFDSSNGGHDQPVDYLALMEKKYLASSSSNYQVEPGKIKVLDLTTLKLKYTFDKSNGGHDGYIFDMIPLEKYSLLASASEDKTIKLWDYTTGKLRHTFDKTNGGHSEIVWTMIYIGGGLMASGAGDINGTVGELKVWDVSGLSLRYSFNKTNGGIAKRIYSFVQVNNNSDLVSGSVDHTIKVWDTMSSGGGLGRCRNIERNFFIRFCLTLGVILRFLK
jgi:WD40 repeat protein